MKRITYLDLLKIFACIGVVTIHVSMQNINSVLTNSYQYAIFNIFSSIARYAVPIFIMVSGVNLLDNNKELSMKKLYTKYISKMLVCYIFWSIIYAIVFENFSLNGFVYGNYHLWYLLMLIGLYMITPLFREITKSLKLTRYFILLGIVFAFLIPNIFTVMKLFPCLDETEKLLYFLNKRLSFSIVICYPVYYMLGYYLHNINISRKKEILLFCLGLLGVSLTVSLSYITTNNTLNVVETFYELSSIAILMESMAVFVFFKNHLNYNKYNNSPLLQKITTYTFGIYLIHPLLLDNLPFTTMAFNPLLSVPIIIILILLISFLISIILNIIPVVKKWIV